MSEADLPPDVVHLISTSVPTVDALEVLVAIACAPDRVWTAEEIAVTVRPVEQGTLLQYLRRLEGQGLLIGEGQEGFRFRPSAPVLEAAVAGLCSAYNKRPVTLIRVIYAFADQRQIRSFADAFRLRRED